MYDDIRKLATVNGILRKRFVFWQLKLIGMELKSYDYFCTK